MDLLERVGVDAAALDAAVAAHIVERENGTICFTHPLLLSLRGGGVLFKTVAHGKS